MRSRILCKDCRHLSREWHSTVHGRCFSVPGEYCTATAAKVVKVDPIRGETVARMHCRAKNRHFDCPDFEAVPKRLPWNPWRDPVMWLAGFAMAACCAAGIACVVGIVWKMVKR